MITEKKLNKVNDALLMWKGASADFNSFKDSMSNSLIIALYRENEAIALNLGAVQYIQAHVHAKDLDLYCEKTVFDEIECFLLKDRNSEFKVIVGSAIRLGKDFVVAASD